MKIGLVLEGGAMRGMYTAGVLDCFLDAKIHIDGIMGVSAGALFGISFASAQRGRSLRYTKQYNADKRYIGIGSWLKTGNIVNTEFAYGTIPKKLDPFDEATFEERGIPFWCVVTNIETGAPEYMRIENGFDQIDALRASASMPFLSRPVEINGRRYLDGGIADPIPYEKMLDLGYGKLIVIRPRTGGYQAPMSAILIDLFFHRYPQLAHVMKNRDPDYQRILEGLRKLEEIGTALVLCPSVPFQIARLEKDPDKLQQVYNIGMADANMFLTRHPDLL